MYMYIHIWDGANTGAQYSDKDTKTTKYANTHTGKYQALKCKSIRHACMNAQSFSCNCIYIHEVFCIHIQIIRLCSRPIPDIYISN